MTFVFISLYILGAVGSFAAFSRYQSKKQKPWVDEDGNELSPSLFAVFFLLLWWFFVPLWTLVELSSVFDRILKGELKK